MTGGFDYMILLYHGVHADDVELGSRNSSGKHLPRSRFAAEMRYLSANHPLVTIRKIADAHSAKGVLPDDCVAVSFDDGFINNYTDAWPILEKFGVPATLYHATGFIGTGRMIWSDRLEAAFLGSDRDALDIEVAGHRLSYLLTNDDARVSAFLEVKALCKTLPNDDKNLVVEAVVDALAYTPRPDHPLYGFMNWDQVCEMDASPLIDIGAHTVNHVSLAKVDEEEMRREIDDSISKLVRELGHPCDLFSYPEGGDDDVSEAVIDHLRARGLDHFLEQQLEDVGKGLEHAHADVHRPVAGMHPAGRPIQRATLAAP